MDERQLKRFLQASECSGKTVSKIVTTEGGSIAIHFGNEEVAVFIFGEDASH